MTYCVHAALIHYIDSCIVCSPSLTLLIPCEILGIQQLSSPNPCYCSALAHTHSNGFSLHLSTVVFLVIFCPHSQLLCPSGLYNPLILLSSVWNYEVKSLSPRACFPPASAVSLYHFLLEFIGGQRTLGNCHRSVISS